MDRLESALLAMDQALGTKRKRHIMGGILMRISLLFGGLAVTVMSLKKEEKNE